MAQIEKFEDLEVWKLSRNLCKGLNNILIIENQKSKIKNRESKIENKEP